MPKIGELRAVPSRQPRPASRPARGRLSAAALNAIYRIPSFEELLRAGKARRSEKDDLPF